MFCRVVSGEDVVQCGHAEPQLKTCDFVPTVYFALVERLMATECRKPESGHHWPSFRLVAP